MQGLAEPPKAGPADCRALAGDDDPVEDDIGDGIALTGVRLCEVVRRRQRERHPGCNRAVVGDDVAIVSASRAVVARLTRVVRRQRLTSESAQRLLVGFSQWHAAWSKMVTSNLRLVVHLVQRSWRAGVPIDDLIQEGMIGLYKAVRDFRPDKETSFRSFAELCVTRQIITAIKTATRYKHAPLNTYVSFSHTPAGQDSDSDCTLGDALPGPRIDDPIVSVMSTEELKSLVFCLGTGLSPLESQALKLYLEGSSYEDMAEELGCDTKTIDNALQRVKRKVLNHQQSRQVIQ